MAFKRVLVLIQVGSLRFAEDKHTKETQLKERVCAGKANA